MMFESTGDVLDKIRLLQLKWKSSFVPAMLEFITNLKHKEPLDDINICGEDIDEGVYTLHGIHAHGPISAFQLMLFR